VKTGTAFCVVKCSSRRYQPFLKKGKWGWMNGWMDTSNTCIADHAATEEAAIFRTSSPLFRELFGLGLYFET
jgi:hypothetical protein